MRNKYLFIIKQYFHLFGVNSNKMDPNNLYIQRFIGHGSFSFKLNLYEHELRCHEVVPNTAQRRPGILEDSSKIEAQVLARFIILDPCLKGPNLMDCIITHRKESQINSIDIAKKLIKQMLYGVKFLHDRNFVHRDLKPQNFIFEKNFKTDENQVDDTYDCDSPENTRLILNTLDLKWLVNVNVNTNIIDDIINMQESKNDDNNGHNHDDDAYERLQKMNGVVLTEDANFMSPELAFHLWFYIWCGNDHDGDVNKLKDDNIDKYIGDGVMKNDDQRCKDFTQMVSTLSEKQYLQEHDDIESVSDEYRDLNKKLFEKYQCLTPQILKASDIWSIGIIAYLIMTGKKPFGRFRMQKYIVESIVTSTGRLNFPQIDSRYLNNLDDNVLTPAFKVMF